MKRLTAFLCASFLTIPATAQTVPEDVANTRIILAGTVAKGGTAYKDYLAGKKDATTAFKGALAAYRALDLVKRVVVTPDPVPTIPTTGLAPIASNFDASQYREPAALPPSAAPDVVGAFRLICQAGQPNRYDPIVYPGELSPHVHQPFGNTGISKSSTYESLRTTGDSTCMNPLNRSAYWIPAMFNGLGQIVVPDYVAIYYKRFPMGDPRCAQQGIACADLPRGLRYVYGWSMTDPLAAKTGSAYFNCDGPGATQGHYENILEAAKFCPVGSRLGAIINAPDCWDGKNLDSPDHRSHVAYGSYDPNDGIYKCPKTHGYVIPTFTQQVWYLVAPGDQVVRTDGRPGWHLSSDVMGDHMMTPGSTFHADWFGAWDEATMRAWQDNCLNKLLSCFDGNLGNGTIMKRRVGFGYTASPHLVPLPS